MSDLIGLTGFARSGKNTFADIIIDSRIKNGAPILGVKTLSFAYALRKELDSFVYNKIGISTFTEDPVEKEIIRPLLVCWGTEIIRNHVDKDYWINSIKKYVEINRKNNISSIITDVRFENELDWIEAEGGVSIFVDREGIGPKNCDELNFTAPLKEKCNHIFSWPNLSNALSDGKEMVQEFLCKNNLCHLTAQTNSLQTT